MEVPVKKEDCETAVWNYLNSSDFVLKDYKVRPLGNTAAGFMGQHLKLTASVQYAGQLQQITLFVKMIPSSDKHRSLIVSLNLFETEVKVFNDFIPRMTSCLPSGTPLPVPKCYFTRGTPADPGKLPASMAGDREIIILEDLSIRGYRLRENFPPMDVPHCHVVLRAMALYHASSILLEEFCRKSHPEDFDPLRDLFAGMTENFLIFQEGHLGYECVRHDAESKVTASLKLWPEKFQGVSRDAMLKALMGMWKKISEMAKPSSKYPNVLCHGDPWTNNIMFKYGTDEQGREVPVDAVFVDLQVTRYAAPVTDILIFLHVCTRRAFRDRHTKDFLKFYHDVLSEYVPKAYIDKLLPFERFLEMYGEYRDFGRVICSGYLPIILSENDPLIAKGGRLEDPLNITESIYSDRGDKIERSFHKSKSYREWITDSFQELLEELNLWRS